MHERRCSKYRYIIAAIVLSVTSLLTKVTSATPVDIINTNGAVIGVAGIDRFATGPLRKATT